MQKKYVAPILKSATRPCTGDCMILADCDALEEFVPPGVVSSKLECEVCEVAGVCRGLLISSVLATDPTGCLGLCKIEPGCTWFSFDTQRHICDCLATCDYLAGGGSSGQTRWVSGEASCPTSALPSTTTSTTNVFNYN